MFKYKSKEYIFFTFISVVAFFIIYLASRNFGLGTTSDSVEYIVASKSFNDGKGFLMLNNQPMVWWPPVYPILLGLVSKIFSADTLNTARNLNSLLFGITVFLSGVLIHRNIKSSFLFTGLCTISILLSFQIIQMALMALTELLFICLVLFCFVFLESYMKENKTKYLIILAIFVSLAALTRYIGIILIPWVVLNILIVSNKSLNEKIRHILLFMLISSLPVLVWIARNYIQSGTLFGYRFPVEYSLGQNLLYILNVFSAWYVPFNLRNSPYLFSILLTITAVIIVITLREALKNQKQISKFYPYFIFVLLYLLFIVYIIMNMGIEQVSKRLLAPIYIPLTIIMFFIVFEFSHLITTRVKTSALQILPYAAISIFILMNYKGTQSGIIDFSMNGEGFTSKKWRESKVIAYSQQNKILSSNNLVYSNFPDAIYVLTNFKSEKTAGPQKLNEDIERYRNVWPKRKNAFVLWFNELQPYLYRFEELQRISKMQEIKKLEDGTIYFIPD